ncbi:hypothetical protein WJX84_002781 [Apatococcus fuscideae]|uniref:Non-specific serine/threonine protein kinase n=1 Tax=Apatococcus fuscideae TaxID=2026836 RepID=A0AAW1TE48_9CHLO
MSYVCWTDCPQCSPDAKASWYATVTRLRGDISAWTSKQSKHANVGYPLATQLICLEPDETFPHSIDQHVDALHRLLKDKLLRTLSLGCLTQCIVAFLVRYAKSTPADKVSRWLARCLKPILSNLRKGNLQFSEQQDYVRQICVAVADRAPEYSVTGLLLDLLTAESLNWDCIMIGLKALLAILLGAPIKQAGQLLIPASDQQQWRWDPGKAPQSASAEVLTMLRTGHQPLEAYGVAKLTPRLQGALTKVILTCHSFFMNYRSVGTVKSLSEVIPKERAPGLPVFRQALACVPFILPEHWANGKLVDELPAYTTNGDASIRSEAINVMIRVLRGLPRLRNAVLQGQASFARSQGLPDDHPEQGRDALNLMCHLMDEWVTILKETAQGNFEEPWDAKALHLELPRLEAVALASLCSIEADVRRAAMDALAAAKRLHQALIIVVRGAPATSPAAAVDTVPEEEPTYAADVLEEVGQAVAQRCFWDFGRCSDLQRDFRPVDNGRRRDIPVDLEGLAMRVGLADDGVRWARCLAEFMKHTGQLCGLTTRYAYIDICARILLLVGRDCKGLTAAGLDPYAESQRLDLIRTYCMAATACPPPTHPSAGLPTRELFRLLINIVRIGSQDQQQAAMLALGCCNSDCHEVLLQELQPLTEEYMLERFKAPSPFPISYPGQHAQGTRSRQRQSELRVLVAHIYRYVAGALWPGALRSSAIIRDRIMGFINDTFAHLSNASLDAYFEPLDHPGNFPGGHRSEVKRAVNAVKTRLKDPEASKAEAEMLEMAEAQEHAAHLGMAAMLQGPAFDADARKPQGRIFTWIDRMFTSKILTSNSAATAGPSKAVVARNALMNLLSSNPDVMEGCIDQCYAPNTAVARGYFEVIAEGYTTANMFVRPHVLMCLVLYKIVDPSPDIRSEALHVLGVMSVRLWHVPPSDGKPPRPGKALPGGGGALPASNQPKGRSERVAVVIGNVQDAYQQFQYQLSMKLAKEHPEVSEALCVEMMTRQLGDELGNTMRKVVLHQVLMCLAPWMENLSLNVRWEGGWTERLLKSMYYVTQQHGNAFPQEVERLWCTMALNSRNVIPILDFIISYGIRESAPQDLDPVMAFFAVSKRICIYLARVASQQTVDHLVYELSQLILEEEDGADGSRSPESTSQAREFHQVEWPSRQNSGLSSFDPLGGSGRLGGNLFSDGSLTPTATGGFWRAGSEPLGGSITEHKLKGVNSFNAASINDTAMRSGSETAVDAISRRSSAAPVSPGRGLLTRPELSLCLVAEVAYEHDEGFRTHLPLVLHTMMLLMDSVEPLVFRHAQIILIHLLYSLSAQHLEVQQHDGGMIAEYERVTGLIRYMQSVRGRQMWAYEEVSLRAGQWQLGSSEAMGSLANAILDSIFFESGLRERWAEEALRWMLEAGNRHLACRSHQIYRALQPKASIEASGALLASLARCLGNPSQMSLEVAIEIILTLQVVVESMGPGKLVLYPQITLTAVGLLATSYVHLYALNLGLFSRVLERLDFNDSTVQNVLMAGIPKPDSENGQSTSSQEGSPAQAPAQAPAAPEEKAAWPLAADLLTQQTLPGGSEMLCVQQLLVKGLFQPDTLLLTVQVMTQLAEHIAHSRPRSGWEQARVAPSPAYGRSTAAPVPESGLGEVLGDPLTQLAISISALLPWMALHFRHSPDTPLAAACTAAHAQACSALGLDDLAHAFLALCADTTAHLDDVLHQLIQPLSRAFFPRFGKALCQRLMEVLRVGQEAQKPLALQLLRHLFQSPSIHLGPPGLFATDGQLFAAVAALLQGPLAAEALQVMDAAMIFSQRAEGPDLGRMSQPAGIAVHWPHCLDEGECSQHEKTASTPYGIVLIGIVLRADVCLDDKIT